MRLVLNKTSPQQNQQMWVCLAGAKCTFQTLGKKRKQECHLPLHWHYPVPQEDFDKQLTAPNDASASIYSILNWIVANWRQLNIMYVCVPSRARSWWPSQCKCYPEDQHLLHFLIDQHLCLTMCLDLDTYSKSLLFTCSLCVNNTKNCVSQQIWKCQLGNKTRTNSTV